MKDNGETMNLNFMELKAKHQPKEFTFKIYPADFDKFSKFVEYINRDKATDELIAEEDIFEELMKATAQVDGFDEFLASGKGGRRGKRRNSTEQ